MASTTTLIKKSIDSPDEVREFPSGRIEMLEIGDVSFARTTFAPGWRWSEHVKPIAGTESCQFPHELFVVSGRLHVVMDDGSELDLVPGDVGVVGPGHDAWVTGDEPFVAHDWCAEDADYAKP